MLRISMNNYKNLFVILWTLVLISCNSESIKSPIFLFSEMTELEETKCGISDDCLAQVEGIQCNDTLLVAMDYHSGKSFTLFKLTTGEMIGRFGSIGQGVGEIPLGTYCNLQKDCFSVSYEHTGYIGKYNMDSLCSDINARPVALAKFIIPEAQLSRIMPVNDSLFLGAGTYNSEYQYLLFDKDKNVIDYAIKIYNHEDETMNKYHKFLSNQGVLRKRPGKNQFVYSINNSSNIDIINIDDNRIVPIQLSRLNNPQYQPVHDSKFNRVIPDRNCVIGYLDICATEQYIYALYTDKKMYNNGVRNSFNSDLILVFDWNGNPITKYKISNEAYYITVDETSQKMYAVVKNESKGWSIICYSVK